MSGVDVLALLDDLVADMGDTPGTAGHKVAQASAAVAELIRAADAVVNGAAPAKEQLAAALANVRGAA